jgi:hypothetical protein
MSMQRLLTIPRDALAELLQAAGSPLTPEQYLASLPALTTFVPYAGRATMAAMSKYVLLLVTIVSGLFLLGGLDVEGVIILVALSCITYYEFRVHRYFVEWNPEAPTLGFRNQCAFASFIVIYCVYHVFAPFQLPPVVQDMIDPSMASSIRFSEQVFYVVIALVGGASQFWLAWYYRSASTA